jgi:hypothetical protein
MKQVGAILTLSIFALVSSPWNSAETSISDGTFVAASVTNSNRASSNQQHAFTLVMPERAGEKFSMLSISLQARKAGALPIPFDIKTAQAFVGGSNGQRQAIAIQQTWIDETGTLWLEFKPSLPPKTKLTLSLAAKRLPTQTTYEYGIAAYADSEYPAAVLVDTGVVTLQ